MRGRRVSGTAALAVVVTAALRLSACADPTQITVVVTTDLPCDSLKGMTFTAGPPGTIETGEIATSTMDCAAREPRTLVLVPTGAKDSAVAVRVVVGVERPATECMPPLYRGCIVARRNLRYLPQTSLTLPIQAERSCLDVPCDQASSCRANTCVEATASCADGVCSIPPDAPVVSTPDAGPPVVALDDAGDKDAGARDAGARDAGDAGDAADHAVRMSVELSATRPAALGDASAPDAAFPTLRSWLPLQYRSVSGTADRLGPIVVALETANRARITLDGCTGACAPPSLSVITTKGTFTAPVVGAPSGSTTEFDLTPNPGDPGSVLTNDDLCLVVSSASLPRPRRVLARIRLADFDGTGIVESSDFTVFRANFGSDLADASEKHADLDSNGFVDGVDFDRFRTVFLGTARDAGDLCPP